MMPADYIMALLIVDTELQRVEFKTGADVKVQKEKQASPVAAVPPAHDTTAIQDAPRCIVSPPPKKSSTEYPATIMVTPQPQAPQEQVAASSTGTPR